MTIEATAANLTRTVRVRVANYIDGNLADASTALLSNSGGTLGIERLDTGAAVVADATTIPRIELGIYEYEFEPPAVNTTYRAYVEVTQTAANGSRVDRSTVEFLARRIRTSSDPYLETDEDLRIHGLQWVDELRELSHGQVDWSDLRLQCRREVDRIILARAPRNRREGIREQLNRGELLVTPELEMASCYWCYARALESAASEPTGRYSDLAMQYNKRWRSIMGSFYAEFDSNGEGLATSFLDCGSVVQGNA